MRGWRQPGRPIEDPHGNRRETNQLAPGGVGWAVRAERHVELSRGEALDEEHAGEPTSAELILGHLLVRGDLQGERLLPGGWIDARWRHVKHVVGDRERTLRQLAVARHDRDPRDGPAIEIAYPDRSHRDEQGKPREDHR